MMVVTALGGCSSGYPDAPRVVQVSTQPPAPAKTHFISVPQAPKPPKNGIMRIKNSDVIGTTAELLACQDCIYPMTIGLGIKGATAEYMPHGFSVELPPGEHLRDIVFDNGELFGEPAASYTGSLHKPTYTVVFKFTNPELGGRTERATIFTNERKYQLQFRGVPCQTRADGKLSCFRNTVTTLRLTVAPSVAQEGTGCEDHNFVWLRDHWQAPVDVCTDGVFTVVRFQENIALWPEAYEFITTGEPRRLNWTKKGNNMLVDGSKVSITLKWVTGETTQIVRK